MLLFSVPIQGLLIHSGFGDRIAEGETWILMNLSSEIHKTAKRTISKKVNLKTLNIEH